MIAVGFRVRFGSLRLTDGRRSVYNHIMIPDGQLLIRLKNAYGERTEEIVRGFGVRRKSTLRANTLKASDEEIAFALSEAGIAYERIGSAFAVDPDHETRVRALPEYANGSLYMQNPSSMIPPLVLGAKAGENILDMCAAPGGKTSQIAALTGNGAFITACEKDRIRAERLKHNLTLLGVRRVNVMLTDSSKLDPAMKFDRILLDAPCTGSGTVAPRSPGKYSEKLLAGCVRAQRALIKRAVTLLKKGGTLVYSTCSLLPEENEEAAAYAVTLGAETEKIDLRPERARLLCCGTRGALLIAPDEYYEGFFVAKFVVG